MKETAIVLPGEEKRPHRQQRVAVVPAFNEESTIVDVLERLSSHVDRIIVIDDGSTDSTRQRLLDWSLARDDVHLVLLDHNQGLSAAYGCGFAVLKRLLSRGLLTADDLVVTIDADGQHDPADIERLVECLEGGKLSGVIARRDLSGYSACKRLGNWLLSLWASLWGGFPFRDVESGFRVLRLGALVEALRYYQGYRYSETIELAVVLARLGYPLANDVLVPVPVRRSRTSLLDGLIDFVVAPLAWWRVWTGRHRPRGLSSKWACFLPAVSLAGLLFMVVDLLVHPLFLGDDSVHHYAHVWYLSQQLFAHHSFPLHVELLDGGRAVAFPYGLPVYLVSALLYRWLGDWSVTLLMAIALVGTVAAAMLARPVVRDPWALTLFLLNPFLIDAVYAFQFTSLWATLFFFLWVRALERGRRFLAPLMLWLTVSAHPIMGGVAVLCYVLVRLWRDRRQAFPLAKVSWPVVPALLPVFWLTLQTPALHETAWRTALFSVLDVLPRRGSVMAMPFLLEALAPRLRQLYLPSLAAGLVITGLTVELCTGPIQIQAGVGSYYGALHGPAKTYEAFFASPYFQPGAVYRVLEPNEREDGMYRFMQHGAILAHEFFSESVRRQDWPSPEAYRCYLAYKGVDYVVVERAFQRQYSTNEEPILRRFWQEGRVGVHYQDPEGQFTVYDVRSLTMARPRPSSLAQCGLL